MLTHKRRLRQVRHSNHLISCGSRLKSRQLVDLTSGDDVLVRGQAGSGKTTVLAARAGRLLSAMNAGTLLFLTYNSALS